MEKKKSRNKHRSAIRNWEVASFFFMVLVGSFLHFVPDLWPHPVGQILGPVRESVWEHLKLGYWSLLAFALLKYYYLKHLVRNFLLALALAVLALQLFIIVFHYSYEALPLPESVAAHIISYILGAALAHYSSYKTLGRETVDSLLSVLALAFLVLHAFLLVIFTYHPPEYDLFKDKSEALTMLWSTDIL